MIIALLVLVSIIFFVCCNLFMSHHIVHAIGTTISVVLLLFAVGLSVANFKYHYGMHISTCTSDKYIYPTVKNSKLLVYAPLGSKNKEQIILYRLTNRAHKPVRTKASSYVYNKIHKTNYLSPKVQVTKHRYVYNNKFDRLMFHIAMKDQTHKEYNTFDIPKAWTVLSVNQAKVMKATVKQSISTLQKQNKSPQVQQMMKYRVQEQVQVAMEKALQSDPSMTTKQQQKLQRRIINKVQDNVKKQSMNQIMAKALMRAKRAPIK